MTYQDFPCFACSQTAWARLPAPSPAPLQGVSWENPQVEGEREKERWGVTPLSKAGSAFWLEGSLCATRCSMCSSAWPVAQHEA